MGGVPVVGAVKASAARVVPLGDYVPALYQHGPVLVVHVTTLRFLCSQA